MKTIELEIEDRDCLELLPLLEKCKTKMAKEGFSFASISYFKNKMVGQTFRFDWEYIWKDYDDDLCKLIVKAIEETKLWIDENDWNEINKELEYIKENYL